MLKLLTIFSDINTTWKKYFQKEWTEMTEKLLEIWYNVLSEGKLTDGLK